MQQKKIKHKIEFEDEELSKEEIKEIKIGLKNIEKGEVQSIEQVAKDMGILLKEKKIR
ncbi:hypothetical protein J4463_01230 [Candidatus Pacearchaeota archaeon]|nr:hypothetical protein [Candidatus Pacearchaeota archaeon]